MTHADIRLFQDGVTRPHVAEWWPDSPPSDELDAWCTASRDGAGDANYIALLDGDPVGFIQCYTAIEGHDEGWWLDECDPGVRGIDQFLANPQQLGRGLGSALVRAFTAALFDDASVTRIQCDPAPHNRRAIRCYEKAGFYADREVSTPDGAALLMYRDRDE